MAVADAEVAMTAARVLWSDATTLPAEQQASVVTVGTFDGVHRGHRRVIGQTVDEARTLGAQAVALTWDRHPKSVVGGAVAPPLVTSIERKVELLAESGVDLVVVLRLDEALRRWSPERFVRDVFAGGLQARSIVVGSDWRFGYGAAGDVRLLAKLGSAHGFHVTAVDRGTAKSEAASSTLVRDALIRGDLAQAAALLGRPVEIEGRCPEMRSAGGVLSIPSEHACPPAGRYRARVRTAGLWAGCDVEVDAHSRIRLEFSDPAASLAQGAAAVTLQLTGAIARLAAPLD